ncbi:MAG: hypothetical protein OQK79_06630 [Rhodanobacter sp.]|nr:hypothetical protein [Rhodanobacter sp.]
MTSESLKAQGKNINRVVLTGSLLREMLGTEFGDKITKGQRGNKSTPPECVNWPNFVTASTICLRHENIEDHHAYRRGSAHSPCQWPWPLADL